MILYHGSNKDLVLKLMEEQKMSMSDALDAVYNSDMYENS